MLSDMITNLQNSLQDLDRTVLLRYLNRAYKELYDTFDLPNSVTDEYFEINGADGQIVLPEYVDSIRGAGAYMARVPIRVSDFRSGYRITPQFQHPYEWCVRAVVPLSSQMDATDQIRVVLQDEETETVNVYITGATATSAVYTETLTFEPGTVSQTTTAQFVADNPYALTMIAKDRPTRNDVKFYVNTTGTEISTLRNRYLRAQYQLIQITDTNPTINVLQPPFNGAKIVYKKTFTPLYYDTDEIIYAKGEDMVVWKARELWFGEQSGEDAITAAAYAYKKTQALLTTLVINQESEAEMKMSFARNPYATAWRASRRVRWPYGNVYQS